MKRNLLVALLSLAIIFTFMPTIAFGETDMPAGEPAIEAEETAAPAPEAVAPEAEETEAPAIIEETPAAEEPAAGPEEEAVAAPAERETPDPAAVEEEPIIAAPASWEYHSGGWKYLQEDNSYASGWCEINEYYYYFDPGTGYAVTGWKKIGGYWYYFAKDGESSAHEGAMFDEGVMHVNGKLYYFGPYNGPAAKWGKLQYKWIKATNGYGDTVWYYADPNKDGQLALGWKKIDGKWYYFAPTNDSHAYYNIGQMYADGPATINGKLYIFDKNGAMGTGWVKISDAWTDSEGNKYTYTDWWYADPAKDSQLATGWKKIDGKWYYFDLENGWMFANDTWRINDKLYAFNRNGSLHETAGWVNLYEEWTDKNGKKQTESYWVYTDKNGIAATGWKKIDGEWYLFDSDWGYMQHDTRAVDSAGILYLGSNGKAYKNKWLEYDGWWYYFNASGYMVADRWIKIDGEWYCFNEDGQMLHDQWIKDSVDWMWLGSNGKPYRNKWLQDADGWHYLKANGYEAKNEWAKDGKGWLYMNEYGIPTMAELIEYNGDLYYLDENGYMVTSMEVRIGKDYYYFDASGKGTRV